MTSSDADPTFHADTQLCEYLLGSIVGSIPLGIRESAVSQAGSGLFAQEAVPECQEVFRSEPVVECVADGLADSVCDLCYANILTKVHPSGRFRTKDDVVPDMMPCTQCEQCYYCSESCRDKAWEAYHQQECSLMSKSSGLSSRVRALHRILIREKHDLLPPMDRRTLDSLASHYGRRLAGPDAGTIDEIARTAKERTGTSRSIEEVSRLYCAIQTNNVFIRESGQSQALGTAIDVPMSLMNHSCEPNVVTVFEGSELRVRSLRKIKAGEELVQCYTDVTCDVLMRRKRLKEQFFFDCACPRCEREFEKHKQRTLGDANEIEFVRQAQEELTELINRAIVEMRTSPAAADGLPLVELEAHARNLINDAFPASRWPDTLDPVPLLYKRLGNMHSLRGSGVAAFQCGVKGCAFTDWKLGPEWVYDLHDLVRLMTAIVVQPPNRAVFRDKTFLNSKEFWDVYHGLLHMLFRASEKTFGSDTAYTRAVRKWFDDTVEGTEEPLPGSPKFQDRFRAAHEKLLSWAGVDERYWPVSDV